MCPIWECDNNIEDPAVVVRCSSYDGALDIPLEYGNSNQMLNEHTLQSRQILINE